MKRITMNLDNKFAIRKFFYLLALFLAFETAMADDIRIVPQLANNYKTIKFISDTRFVAQSATEIAFYSLQLDQEIPFLKTHTIPGAFFP